jgi:hypothetical protein
VKSLFFRDVFPKNDLSTRFFGPPDYFRKKTRVAFAATARPRDFVNLRTDDDTRPMKFNFPEAKSMTNNLKAAEILPAETDLTAPLEDASTNATSTAKTRPEFPEGPETQVPPDIRAVTPVIVSETPAPEDKTLRDDCLSNLFADGIRKPEALLRRSRASSRETIDFLAFKRRLEELSRGAGNQGRGDGDL